MGNLFESNLILDGYVDGECRLVTDIAVVVIHFHTNTPHCNSLEDIR